MTTEKNPFEAMMAMGQEWAEQLKPAMDSVAPKGFEDLFPTISKEMMEQFMGKGANPEGLDAKTKLLLTLHGLTIAGATAEPQIKLTVRHAVQAGATPQEIAETIAQAAMFGGVPAMTKAMEIATDVLDKDKNA
jgi:4-carboxymuconolactone decarboxylase